MNDLISRQAAIDEIKALYEWHDIVTEDRAIDHFKRLPSAQPEITEDDVKEFCRKRCLIVVTSDLYDEMIRRWASAERRGRWIEEYSANHFQAKCSACGESTIYGITYDLEGNAYYMNYCPHCGARMAEDGTD